MHTPIPDMYHVKWFAGCWRYGIVSRWDPESIRQYNDNRHVIVEDAITPAQHVISVDALVPIPATHNPADEYTNFVEEQFQIAKIRSDSLPSGLHVGKMFRVPRGDGYAYYVVTKVNKKTVHIEWRGYCLDRWVDDRFGYGGREKHEHVEMFVNREDGLRRLFSASTAGDA